MAKFKPIIEGSIDLPEPQLLKAVIYDGAHVEYEAIKKGIDGLSDHAVTDFMRQALIDHLGSSKITPEADGYVEAITMAGYITDPNGRTVPAALVARSINVGTNLTAPTRFISKAVSAARRPAEEAMRVKAEEILRKAGN